VLANVGTLLIASATVRNAETNGIFSVRDWEIEQIIFNELMAEPADGLTFDAIFMLPEFVEQDVDPEVIGYCLERLVERGSLERWDGLHGGDDSEMRYRLTFREWIKLRADRKNFSVSTNEPRIVPRR
jgi:hypothetical protein